MMTAIILFCSCEKQEEEGTFQFDNPELAFELPAGFPALNNAFYANKPTQYAVELGERLFNEPKFSGNNTISCGSCHNPNHAFADNKPRAIGINDRVGLRNTPPIQNMAFMQFYNWDGNILELEKQPLVPIITHEEMNSSILEVIAKLEQVPAYRDLFWKAFGDPEITPERIYRSIAQYEYTLVSANSKYDRIKRQEGEQFTETEAEGYRLFQQKCASCHATELFTDQSFRNVGFPANSDTQEAGRARVTGLPADYMQFRVPSLRNIVYTAPYGSFGQFATLRDVLDYFDKGVSDAANLDPLLKANGNRIPLNENEKEAILSFLETLSDEEFVGQ
ncbi:cytochrome-c peroxidase [Sphingobacterium deserti]|uniref:Cytochrome-c peroxidase n=1 Tax=Sphingobacterium deserti TaxID=1229276 RepID=A0A0B8SZ28_9SPHI|nr:cytochrome c peroxidase [Sphingobacterium deserti]KGE12822.1 cytochrome-c peroxidase [Sphingobacterium deserti]